MTALKTLLILMESQCIVTRSEPGLETYLPGGLFITFPDAFNDVLLNSVGSREAHKLSCNAF